MTRDQHTLTGGQLNLAIANAVVRGHRRYIGRGPTKARVFYQHNVIVVLMYDALTQAERSLIADGRGAAAHHVRAELQQTMRAHLIAAVEELTGCGVAAFISGSHLDPDVEAELFVLDRPVPGEQAPTHSADEPRPTR